MEESIIQALGQVVGPVFMMAVLSTLKTERETPITFPYRLKDFARFSLDHRWIREDWITVVLFVMAIPILLSGEYFYIAGIYALFGVVSHVLIHLRRISVLVPTQNVQIDEADDTPAGMRVLFLTIVKRWHPDHAKDIHNFLRRNHITALATRAMRENDSKRLRDIASLKQ